ncbi:hypothetical protein bcgnr5378_37040 [Bacillus cereus]|uniref:Uncharacterized protein n=1 Tax=Bacillus cereus TaxID=1396 RepID=A0A161SY09_BACCE|nr:hypothetical protein [Bacillus cereus]KZD71965.1 hypothetical protein B4088_0426 [Bacillus cereus]HDR8322085.1 hypothetical protein [Bacillus cereus]HDR8328635.1 hypothetical protein [Bacillus cereus]HDR8334271.1 hypothetical protein [Bacillus cereus]
MTKQETMTKQEKVLMDLVKKNGEGLTIDVLSSLSYEAGNYNYDSPKFIEAHIVYSIAIENKYFDYHEESQKVYLKK